METVRTQVLTQSHGDRATAKTVVFVLTNGQSNNHQHTITEANKLHQVSDDVKNIVIGKGKFYYDIIS